jgi:maleamate amidohydrolase
MSDVYADRGYGVGRVGPGSTPAVVVVDFQRAFTEKTDEVPWGGSDLVHRAVGNAERLLEVARERDVLVVHTGFGFREDGADFGMWRHKVPTLGRVTLGSRIAETDPRVLRDSDVVLVKHWASAFSSTPMSSILGAHGVDTVIVLGCTTSGCIRATAVDAQSAGFRVLVPEDGVGDQDEGPHHANLQDIDRRYGDVTTCDEVVDYLRTIERTAA